MKAQHTPGPWWRDDDGFIVAGHGDSYVTIADPNCSKLDIDDREANARLIAAAPELLEALKEIERLLDSFKTGSNEAKSAHIAHFAIKKALEG